MDKRCAVWRKAGDNRTLESSRSNSVGPAEIEASPCTTWLKDVQGRVSAPLSHPGHRRHHRRGPVHRRGPEPPRNPPPRDDDGLPGRVQTRPVVRPRSAGKLRRPEDGGLRRRLHGDLCTITLIPYVSIQEYGNRTDVRWLARYRQATARVSWPWACRNSISRPSPTRPKI